MTNQRDSCARTESMKPTIEYIQARFDEYNALYFNGSLPPLPIKLSNARTFLGKLCYKKQRTWFLGPYRYSDFVLRINTRMDMSEELIQDTILHEMIHYFIAINHLRDTRTHGQLFRREMKRINEAGNRHITISYRPNEAERAQLRTNPNIQAQQI